MTFLKKTSQKLLLLALCLLVAAAALFYFYLIKVDSGCGQNLSGREDACYSVDLFGLLPVARAELASTGPDGRGLATMTMKLTPIGMAAKLAKGNRFELFSAFRAETGAPEEFTISLYDRDGPRYAKTSLYDFENNLLRWEKSYPPVRHKRSVVKEYALGPPSLSPLSALYLIMQRPDAQSADGPLTIQVQDIPYIAQRTKGAREGGVTKNSFAVGKDKGKVEPWRRRMDMKLDLFFQCAPDKGPSRPCYPLRVGLPFNIITMTGEGSGQKDGGN